MFLLSFSSLAEVNTLSTDEGPLRWVPVVESVIPIVIHRKKVWVKQYAALFRGVTVVWVLRLSQSAMFNNYSPKAK